MPGKNMAETGSPKKLPLDALWRARTSKFGDFAGYDMPLQFEGLIPEHNWTRAHAGLFDVSHMGPSFFALPKGHGLEGDDAHKAVAAIIERLVPADIQGLKPGQVRYTMITNEEGGVLDDLMIARPAEPGAAGDLYIVVNAGNRAAGEMGVGERPRIGLVLEGPVAEELHLLEQIGRRPGFCRVVVRGGIVAHLGSPSVPAAPRAAFAATESGMRGGAAS
ncbi:MAG TPA: hypothetical protein PLS69_11660, partial [Terricaulis sp.]|nr:hypothetical protein [Terricaulis sp.]